MNIIPSTLQRSGQLSVFYQVVFNFLHKITGNVGCKHISDAVQLYSDALLTCCPNDYGVHSAILA